MPRIPWMRRGLPCVSIILNAAYLLTCASSATAQPVAGESSPDELSFGTLRVGATAEGSTRLIFADADLSGRTVKVVPPPFVTIQHVRVGKQTYGNLGTFITCDVIVSVKTEHAGIFVGQLHVELGDDQIDVPVDASVLEREPGLARVLVLETPFHRFSTKESALLDAWRDLVTSAKLDPSYVEVEYGGMVLEKHDLKEFNVVLLSGSGLMAARREDFAKLTRFVIDGGRVVIAANRFFVGTVGKTNEFVESFGLKMTDDEPRTIGPAQRVIEIGDAEIAGNEVLTRGVRSLKFFRPSPVAVEDKTKGTILVSAPPYPDQGFVAVARAGEGEVVVLGTSLWWNWIASELETGADNAVLLKNLLTRP